MFLGFHNTDRDSGAIKSDKEENHNQIDIIYVEQDARGSSMCQSCQYQNKPWIKIFANIAPTLCQPFL